MVLLNQGCLEARLVLVNLRLPFPLSLPLVLLVLGFQLVLLDPLDRADRLNREPQEVPDDLGLLCLPFVLWLPSPLGPPSPARPWVLKVLEIQPAPQVLEAPGARRSLLSGPLLLLL